MSVWVGDYRPTREFSYLLITKPDLAEYIGPIMYRQFSYFLSRENYMYWLDVKNDSG